MIAPRTQADQHHLRWSVGGDALRYVPDVVDRSDGIGPVTLLARAGRAGAQTAQVGSNHPQPQGGPLPGEIDPEPAGASVVSPARVQEDDLSVAKSSTPARS